MLNIVLIPTAGQPAFRVQPAVVFGRLWLSLRLQVLASNCGLSSCWAYRTSLLTLRSLLDAAKRLPGISLLFHCRWQQYARRAPLPGRRAAVVQSAPGPVSRQAQHSPSLEHGSSDVFTRSVPACLPDVFPAHQHHPCGHVCEECRTLMACRLSAAFTSLTGNVAFCRHPV